MEYLPQMCNMKKTLIKLKKFIFTITLLPEPSCGNWSCAGIEDIALIIKHIIDLLLPVAGGITVIFLIWGGIQYLTAYGNEEKAQKGKTIIIWSIVGLVVIILSGLIVRWLWDIFGGVPEEIKTKYSPF